MLTTKVSAGLWGGIEMFCTLSVTVSVCASAFTQDHHTIHPKMENISYKNSTLINVTKI